MAKELKGKIVGLKMQKTAQVEIGRTKIHPLYKKIIKSVKKYKAHYENLDLSLGDLVLIKEIKPISKTVFFKIVKKI